MNYTDEYQKAPLHPVLRIHMGTSTIKLDQTILEMEIFQHILSPSSFSYSLFFFLIASSICFLIISQRLQIESGCYDDLNPMCFS